MPWMLWPVVTLVANVSESDGVLMVTLLDADDSVPFPAALTARTWKVYDVPDARPLTVADVAFAAAVTVVVAGDEMISYPVIALPDASVAGVQVTVTLVPLAVTVPIVGADGTESDVGVTLLDGEEAGPSP
jgi:hypothetical protein